MLLPPQVPQPIDSENGSALSKLPPVAKQCAWLTITRHTGSVSPELERAVRRARMKADRVPGPLVAQQPLGERRGGGEASGAIERQHRRELLAGERVSGTDARPRGRSGTSPRAAPGGRAPRARRSHWPLARCTPARACRRRTSPLPVAGPRPQSSSTPPSRARARQQSVVHGGHGDHAVLRRARGRVIERLRPRDLRGRGGNIGRLVDDDRHVASAHAHRRCPAFVGGAHVVLRAGRDDEIGLPHERVRLLARRRRRPAAAPGRAARRSRSSSAWTNSSSSASVDAPFGDGARMIALRPFSALRMLFAGVAPGLVEGVIAATTPTGRAISMRPRSRSCADDADRFRALEIAQQADRLAPVLGDLVRDIAQPGVAHGDFRERPVAAGLDDGPRRGGHGLVHALLIPGLEVSAARRAPRDERGHQRPPAHRRKKYSRQQHHRLPITWPPEPGAASVAGCGADNLDLRAGLEAHPVASSGFAAAAVG